MTSSSQQHLNHLATSKRRRDKYKPNGQFQSSSIDPNKPGITLPSYASSLASRSGTTHPPSFLFMAQHTNSPTSYVIYNPSALVLPTDSSISPHSTSAFAYKKSYTTNTSITTLAAAASISSVAPDPFSPFDWSNKGRIGLSAEEQLAMELFVATFPKHKNLITKLEMREKQRGDDQNSAVFRRQIGQEMNGMNKKGKNNNTDSQLLFGSSNLISRAMQGRQSALQTRSKYEDDVIIEEPEQDESFEAIPADKNEYFGVVPAVQSKNFAAVKTIDDNIAAVQTLDDNFSSVPTLDDNYTSVPTSDNNFASVPTSDNNFASVQTLDESYPAESAFQTHDESYPAEQTVQEQNIESVPIFNNQYNDNESYPATSPNIQDDSYSAEQAHQDDSSFSAEPDNTEESYSAERTDQ
ncbi:MAG: hypothetical protein EZS28_008682 [Streblomastix strix]|uniref:Uncharacterized protein n=1 Tax=Streblomastix strix TaxID=222440 RepID=A0A5J4WL53_9EUKA|nr:MAG: hypothetical protein EZS28_008682 [Streblomastix strix]